MDMPEIKWPERPEAIPIEVWEILPAFPFEYPSFPCSILPLPRMILDKLCPLVAGADIKLSNLTIAPSVVQIGNEVQISCTATNIGTETGERIITCKLEGTTMAEQPVTLAPGESTVVRFSTVPTLAKAYSVSVDGLYGSFRATTEVPPEVPDIRVENLVISPTECLVGETVTISCTAANYGGKVGSKTITCQVS